ncbi:MAG TPA: thiaminase II [Candidatus Paenalcaligenes intestinipullorum]|uniref:Aminopyrimidine aminohydrolase n=1 Tax=Candidatus Paenalcaligenes intestinipullorum TaxID=2838718 RepID=A0A9D2U906_9BURK|nr:thiaminase II [Candidatus Paenalcaligenes intestinipullorum]
MTYLQDLTPLQRLQQSCQAEWQAYTQHEFVRQLGAGQLSAEAFRYYLKQDYLFLIHFARAWGLAVYKSRNIRELRQGLDSLKAIVDVELDLHVTYCDSWGISEDELAELPEERATMAYTRYVLDAGNRGDLLDLHVALVPCLIGYAEIGSWLVSQDFTDQTEANPYLPWINMYISDEFQAAAQAEIHWLNQQLADVSPARFQQLCAVFKDATRLEIDFWQAGLEGKA